MKQTNLCVDGDTVVENLQANIKAQEELGYELQKKLNFAIAALGNIASANWHYSMSRKIANDALVQIGVKS